MYIHIHITPYYTTHNMFNPYENQFSNHGYCMNLRPAHAGDVVNYSDFLDSINKGEVEMVRVQNDMLSAQYTTKDQKTGGLVSRGLLWAGPFWNFPVHRIYFYRESSCQICKICKRKTRLRHQRCSNIKWNSIS